jgi:hypothetical protein
MASTSTGRDRSGHEFQWWLGNGSTFMTPWIVWTFLAVTVAVGIATLIAVGKARARARARRTLKEPVRRIHPTCAASGHNYQIYDTGYRCATCGNHVSSREGELYGRAEDGRHDRRREPR